MKSYFWGGTALAEAPDLLALAAVFFGAMAGVKLEPGREAVSFRDKSAAPRGDRGALRPTSFTIPSQYRPGFRR